MADISSILMLIILGSFGIIASGTVFQQISKYSHSSETHSALIHFFNDAIRDFLKKLTGSAAVLIGVLLLFTVFGLFLNYFHHGYWIAFALSGIGITVTARRHLRNAVEMAVSLMTQSETNPNEVVQATQTAGHWLGIRSVAAALLDLGLVLGAIYAVMSKFPLYITHFVNQKLAVLPLTPETIHAHLVHQTNHEIGIVLLTYGLGILVTAALIKLVCSFFSSAVRSAATAVPKRIITIKTNDPRNPVIMADIIGKFAKGILETTAWTYAITVLAATATLYTGVTSGFFPLHSALPILIPFIILGTGLTAAMIAQVIATRHTIPGPQAIMFRIALTRSIELAGFIVMYKLLHLPHSLFLPIIFGFIGSGILGGISYYRFHPNKTHEFIGLIMTNLLIALVFVIGYRLAGGIFSSDFGFYGVALCGLATVAGFAGASGFVFTETIHSGTSALYELLNPEWQPSQHDNVNQASQVGMALLGTPMVWIGASLTLALTHALFHWFHRLIASTGWESPHIRALTYSADPELVFRNAAQILRTLDAGIMNPEVWLGALIGLVLVTVFRGWIEQRSSKIATVLKRQAHYEIEQSAEICDGTSLPDYQVYYRRALKDALSGTAATLLVTLGLPVGVGVIFGIPGLMGMLVASLLAATVESISQVESGNSTLLIIWSVMCGSAFVFGAIIVRFSLALFI
ncbi:hypothetical protein EBR96_06605 [bacterium]|nr:hypothetical protein [bacterium]